MWLRVAVKVVILVGIMGIDTGFCGASLAIIVEKEEWTKYQADILFPLETQFLSPNSKPTRNPNYIIHRKNRPRLQNNTGLQRAGGNCTPCILQYVDSWNRVSRVIRYPMANARGNHTTWHYSLSRNPKSSLSNNKSMVHLCHSLDSNTIPILLNYLRASIPKLAPQRQARGSIPLLSTHTLSTKKYAVPRIRIVYYFLMYCIQIWVREKAPEIRISMKQT